MVAHQQIAAPDRAYGPLSTFEPQSSNGSLAEDKA